MDFNICDCHCDSILDIAHGKRSLAEKSEIGHLDFPRMVKGQVALQFMALFVERAYKPHGSLLRTLELIDLIKREIAKVDYIDLIYGSDDLLDLSFKRPKLLLAIEGGEAICGKIEVLRCFYDLGIRSMGLTWNNRNELGDGCGEEPGAQGLTKFGRKVVLEMNKLGMLIDVSHLSLKGFWDVLEHSEAPIIASHCCCRSLSENPRNLSDEQMIALAKSGGVMGINFYPPFLSSTKNATLEDVINHIEYACSIMGTEHVALGSDFDGIEVVPKGLESCEDLPKIITSLEERGFSPAEIKNILSDNILRLLKKVLI